MRKLTRLAKDHASYHSHSLASSAKRWLWSGFGAIFLLAFAPLAIQQSGIDRAPAVGAFIDSALPTTTPQASTGPTNWNVVDAFPTLDFRNPLHIAEEPTTDRMYVAEFEGRIVGFDMNVANPSVSTFLDLRNVTYNFKESGLLSFAFHPSYPDSNYVYVFYQYRQPSASDYYSRISRFTVPTVGGPADINSELVLIHQYDKSANHNGGALLFGNDGMLYIAMGDEGGSNNQFDNAQYLNKRLFGGILRIDVDRDSTRSHPIRRTPQLNNGGDGTFTGNYLIPNDNPWLDASGAYLEEFYALGLRNPFRMDLDEVTGTIYFCDVGQNDWEEVNILEKGANYQWPYREGTSVGPGNRPNTPIGADVAPAHEYEHINSANCVVGGILYRGTKHPSIYGSYVFADRGSSQIWAGTPAGPSLTVEDIIQTSVTSGPGLVAFGEDLDHEIYFLNMNVSGKGKIYTLNSSTGPGPGNSGPQPPQLLSQLKIFKDLNTMEPDSFTIPYAQNVPFWSDGALKSRFMIIPSDGDPDTPGEQIGYSEEGAWSFPSGTVFIKHFEFQTDETNLSVTRKIETRLMVHGTDGQYYGLSYRWRDDQTDAELLSTSYTDTLQITTNNGPREVVWYYPNRTECLTCHKQSTGGVLGVKTAQLNGDMTYPSGITANQVKTLAYLGYFDQVVDTNNLAGLPRFPALTDLSAPIEDRAMAYLDANCAYCHNPNTGIAGIDTRNVTTNNLTSLIYGDVTQDLGYIGGRALLPGDLEQSIIYQRMNSLRNGVAMPPLAKNKIDTSGITLIANWINSMASNFNPTPVTPTAGLLASYAFDQNSGTLVPDNSGNGLDGALINGGNWSAGQAGNAIEFDGVDDRVDVLDPSSQLSFPANAFSIATYFRLDNLPTSNAGLLAKGENDVTVGLMIKPNGGVRVLLNDFPSLGASNPRRAQDYNADFLANTWYHLGVTYDGQDLRIYVDGTQVQVTSMTETMLTSDQNFCMAYIYNRGINFPGRIDELKVYSQALDGTEMSALANSQAQGSQAGQSIQFLTIDQKATTDAPFSLSAVASSGLPIDFSIVSGPASVSGNTLTLTGDSGYVVVEARQSGDANFSEAPPVRRQFFVASPGTAIGIGLEGIYYDNIDFTNQIATRTDPEVNFYWGSDAPIPGMQYGTYSVRWLGQIEPPFSGTYTFSTTSDDGIRLWVNGQLLIDQWQNQAASRFSNTIELNALEKVDIRLDYFEYGAYAEVELQWSHEHIDREVIPSSFLSPSDSRFPIDLLSFDARLEGDRVAIDWETHLNETAYTFVVEKAANNQDFEEIDRQIYDAQSLQYRSWDLDPTFGSNFYRLKQIDVDGTTSYSDIREVQVTRLLNDLHYQVYPNPVGSDRILTLEMETTDARQMQLELINTQGQVVLAETAATQRGQSQHRLNLAQLTPGIYFLRLIDPLQPKPIIKRILIP